MGESKNGAGRGVELHERGGVLAFPRDVIAAIGSLVDCVCSWLFGVAESVVGLLSKRWQAPAEFAENLAGGAILVGAKAVSLIQTLIGIESGGRQLKRHEAEAMRRIFGDTLDLARVRIKQGAAGAFSMNDRPFTLGNVLYLKNQQATLALLAHELVHVWQYQNGGTGYAAKALVAQRFGDAYDWQKAAAEGKSWREMDPEQQAELVMDACRAGYFKSADSESKQRFVVNGNDHTAFLRSALGELRRREGAP